MIKNYFRIAFRNLWRNKTFSFITVFGLAVGLTCCLLLFMYVSHELSYDNFQQKADRIVRVTMEYSLDGNVGKAPVTGTKVAPEFVRAFPEVEAGVRLMNSSAIVRHGDQRFNEKRVVYADSSLFRVFSFGLLKGNPQTALAGPNQLVLSKSTARKYFGTEDPLGKVVRVDARRGESDYTITGVVEDAPLNSQIKYDILASFSTLDVSKREEWWSANYATYLLLRTPEALAGLKAKVPGYMKSKSAETEMVGNNYLSYNLEPLRRVHLHSEVEGNFEPNGDLLYIYIFGSIAVLILIIACVNYVNLATTRAVERAQEVGVRKVMGALPTQLFGQFIGESIIITFIALLLGLLLSSLALPLFNQLSDRQFSFNQWLEPANLLVVVGIGVVVSLIAGIYPALVLTRYQPVRVLKGHLKTTGAGNFRRTLIVFQFAITAFLIISTFVVQNQLKYIQNKKLGYDKEHVVILPADRQVGEKIQALKSEFKQNSSVQQVSMAYESPVFVKGGYAMRRSDMPEDQYKMVAGLPVDEDFVKTMGLRILAGSDLTRQDMQLAPVMFGDTANYYHFIINEAAAKELGWTPQQAVGQKIDMGQNRKGEVKAVVENFHFASMRDKIGPLVIFPEGYGNVVLVKLSGSQLTNTLQFMENKWNTLIPSRPFEYEFLDQEFNKLYATETRTGRIFSVFAFLSIFLACLGLFGLSAYTTALRTKEIGIRKVLGASIGSIVALLSQEFLKLVLIAIVIASPLAWYAMDRWLQDFTYRIDIPWWTFLVAGVLAVGVALLTVSIQSIKAALMNPVKSLKTE
ncbi:ABC transporter permease [Telluribacter humicola]|uniref:ABC transporter permease n=1 Tax=Telluribacter humicola TaxID=1720261 RepID=UPI001A965159|nr:ABC transporter permease [Telluribacter humicola]